MQSADTGPAASFPHRKRGGRVYVRAYDPDLLARIGAAFDRAWHLLSAVVTGSERNRRNLAILVLMHVDRGERDPDRLSDMAAADYARRFAIVPAPIRPGRTNAVMNRRP